MFDDRERVLRLLKASAAHPLPPFRWADTTDDDNSSSASSSSSSNSSTDGDGDGDGDGGGKRLIFQGPAEAEEMMWATLHTLSAATRTPLPGPSAPSSTSSSSSSSFSSDSDSPAELTTAERAAAPAAAAAAAEVPPVAAAAAPAPPLIASSNISLAYLGSAMAVGAKDRKGLFRAILYTKKDSFAKTGLGQTDIGKFETKEAFFAGDFDADGREDLAIGAYGAGIAGRPQTGQVDVQYAATSLKRELGRNQMLEGSVVHGRFGWALTVLDWNADGVDDLAVGAPSASFTDEQLNATFPVGDTWQGDGFREWGKVYIYLGHRGYGLAPTAATVIETADDLTGVKNAFKWEPCLDQNQHLTKTGSGQLKEKLSGKGVLCRIWRGAALG